MIDDIFQTYMQMIAKHTPDTKKNFVLNFIETWSSLSKRKGKLFCVLLGLYLILTIVASILLFFQVIKSIVLKAALFIIWIILPIILSKMDDKWREQTFFLNIFYFDSIERAKKLKQVLQDKFKFNSIKQYQMILEDATQEKKQMRERIERQQQKAEQILFGGILGSVLAFIPAIITGLMDNVNQNKDAQKALTQIAANTFLLMMILIAFFSLLYFGKMWEIWKLEKDYTYFSEFHADIKMLTEIEAGLHPSADDLQVDSNEKKEEPQS